MILPLTSALISTWVPGWIFPVALTVCTIFLRSTLPVCTSRGLARRPLRAIPPTAPTTTTAAIAINSGFLFISKRPPGGWRAEARGSAPVATSWRLRFELAKGYLGDGPAGNVGPHEASAGAAPAWAGAIRGRVERRRRHERRWDHRRGPCDAGPAVRARFSPIAPSRMWPTQSGRPTVARPLSEEPPSAAGAPAAARTASLADVAGARRGLPRPRPAR